LNLLSAYTEEWQYFVEGSGRLPEELDSYGRDPCAGMINVVDCESGAPLQIGEAF